MKKKNNFCRDVSAGSIAEEKLKKILQDSGIESKKNEDKDTRAYWDLETSNGIKFEVKYDLYSKRSGNIAIEFWNPKKGTGSGLTSTQADYWAQVLPDDEVWIAPVLELKKFCEENKPLKTIAAGGDDNSSMYLYRKEDILDVVFKKVDVGNIKDFIKYETTTNSSNNS
jgi:hypothetical protein